jgi:hypothetical protein
VGASFTSGEVKFGNLNVGAGGTQIRFGGEMIRPGNEGMELHSKRGDERSGEQLLVDDMSGTLALRKRLEGKNEAASNRAGMTKWKILIG